MGNTPMAGKRRQQPGQVVSCAFDGLSAFYAYIPQYPDSD